MSIKKQSINKTIKRSKRMKAAYDVVEQINNQPVDIVKAVELLKLMPEPKFKASIEVVAKLNIDATKSDQNVRGAASMPSGIGRTMKVAVFAQAAHQKEALDAGADYIIGDEANAKEFIAGTLDIDVVIATPDIMASLMKWGVSKILGPKGLMPNAKIGTVTFDIKRTVESFKKGQATFKNDKAGYVHSRIGLLDFTAEQIQENLFAFVSSVYQAKPAAVKSNFIQSVSLSATMFPSIIINMSEFKNLHDS